MGSKWMRPGRVGPGEEPRYYFIMTRWYQKSLSKEETKDESWCVDISAALQKLDWEWEMT